MSTRDDVTAPLAAGSPTRENWMALLKVCWPEPPMRHMTGPYRPWLERVTSFAQFLNQGAYLDAADLLRPEGWRTGHIFTVVHDAGISWDCGLFHPTLWWVRGKAPTEACARAIAAVRAREAGP